jgi:hypothetical protein
MILKKLKKQPKSIRVNQSNSLFGLWEWDNPIESKLKQIIELNFQ